MLPNKMFMATTATNANILFNIKRVSLLPMLLRPSPAKSTSHISLSRLFFIFLKWSVLYFDFLRTSLIINAHFFCDQFHWLVLRVLISCCRRPQIFPQLCYKRFQRFLIKCRCVLLFFLTSMLAPLSQTCLQWIPDRLGEAEQVTRYVLFFVVASVWSWPAAMETLLCIRNQLQSSFDSSLDQQK